MTAQSAFRVALVCPSVGQTRRGYERFTTDLFRFARPATDIKLFKGAGENTPDEQVVPHVRRTSMLGRVRPELLRYPRYHLEYASFAAGLARHLITGAFDVVHFIDPPLGRLLHLIRRFAPKPFRLLFTNAAPTSYGPLHWSDHVHCVSPDFVQQSIGNGYPRERLSLLPTGLDLTKFSLSLPREELRRANGIADDTLVILAVTSLNRHHKRVDYLIEEASRLEGNFLLWLDGSAVPDGDPTLIELGHRKLGNRFRHTHLESDRVPELFALSDLFVSAATSESFGMSIIEAMSCGLPALVHDSPHFRWLTRDLAEFADLSAEGALRARLAGFLRDGIERRPAAAIRNCYDWKRLAGDYTKLYLRVSSGGACC